MPTIIIVVILAVVIYFAFRSSKKHLTGEETCCSGSVPKRKKNKLTGPVVMKKVITVKGMHCEKCKERVEEALEELDCVSAKVNVRKNIAVVQMTENVEDEKLKNIVKNAGYEVENIEIISL